MPTHRITSHMRSTVPRAYATNKRWLTNLLLVVGFLAGVVAIIQTGSIKVHAAACATPPTDLGSTTITLAAPATATYTVWTRMKAPDSAHNSVNLEVDGTTCYSVGGGSFVATSWAAGSGNWIKYQGGVVADDITLTNLSATNHTFKYIGTQAGVEVDRIIISSDANCIPVGTGDNCQSGDSTSPTVSQQVTAGGQPVSNGQAVSGIVSLAATASDASGIANVQFLIDGNAVTTDVTSPYQYDWNSAGVANGTHTLAARATDTKNNVATTTNVTVNVNNTVPCAGNPTSPSAVRATAATPTSVGLSWTASSAATSCTLQGYRVLRDGVQVNTVTGTSYTDVGLNPSTTYQYTVVAVDTSGHLSTASTAVPGATAADTTAPTAPTAVNVTLRTATSVALAWTASTDNAGIKEYLVFRNGVQVGISPSPSTSFTVSGLSPQTAYNFTVRARDVANNSSVDSAVVTATTLAGTGANLGDLDGDGKVGARDLSILLAHWGSTGVPTSLGDLDGDGKVGARDLSVLLSNWGKNV